MIALHSSREEPICIQIPTPFKIGMVNVYVVVDEAVTLIDAGPNTIQAQESLRGGLKKNGFSLHDIDQVVLTHHHVDHMGLLEYIKSYKQVKVYAHKYAQPYIEMKPEFVASLEVYYQKIYRKYGVPQEIVDKNLIAKQLGLEYSCQSKIDYFLEDNRNVPGMLNWKAIFSPGHSYSDVCFYHPKRKLLISGDHLLEHVNSNTVIAPAAGESATSLFIQYRDSLEKTAELNVEKIFPGHGQSFSGHRQKVLQRLKYQENQALHLKELVEEQPQTVFSLAALVYPKVYSNELLLTVSKVAGYLAFLQNQEPALKVDIDGGISKYYY